MGSKYSADSHNVYIFKLEWGHDRDHQPRDHQETTKNKYKKRKRQRTSCLMLFKEFGGWWALLDSFMFAQKSSRILVVELLTLLNGSCQTAATPKTQ